MTETKAVEEGSCSGREDRAPGVELELIKSIYRGDWDAVKQFFEKNNIPANKIITDYGETALHVAIKAGQDKIAEELVEMMSETDLEIKNASGNTALSSVAFEGTTNMAKRLVEKNKNLLTTENYGHIPVTRACEVCQKEMTDYLYSVTPKEFLKPDNGNFGFLLIRNCINNKMLGLKVKLRTTSSSEIRIPITDQVHNKNDLTIQAFDQLCGLGSMILKLFGIKQIYDLKLRHLYALEVLCCMCNHASTMEFKKRDHCRVIDAIFEATKHGIVEFVVELWKADPTTSFDRNSGTGRNVFMVAIQHRQEKIFNLFYGVYEAWKANFVNHSDVDGNTMLHVAGELAPDFQLARISGAALQMQRELQWYKEVERIVPEWCKEARNCRRETPYEVFIKNHKELRDEGEKWMKNTASSYIIVGTLIVTIMFAVAFTVPGGNQQDTGLPIFLRKRSFMIFLISDAISFFAASTSVLMFLGILTSRFAEEDFLVSLPRKLMIGLSTLFISTTAMMVSFCAALLVMLQGRWWAIIPIILIATIPVTLFVWLQFPLLVEIFVSTYASTIFDKKMKRWL